MSKSFKQALFSALLVWAVAYPVFGLKLAFSGVTLQVQNASPLTLTIIAVCSVLLFLRVLFAEQISGLRRGSDKPLIPQKTSDFLTQPKTQRWASRRSSYWPSSGHSSGRAVRWTLPR